MDRPRSRGTIACDRDAPWREDPAYRGAVPLSTANAMQLLEEMQNDIDALVLDAKIAFQIPD